MSKTDFQALCQLIINAVGEEDFKPESYIKDHLIATGEDYLGSELSLMAGGSFLDIAALYCCGYTYTNEIFH